MQIAGKIFVVTGAGSGIGRELTLQLLQKGAKVAGADIHGNALLETQKLAGVGADRWKDFVIDIGDKGQVDSLPAQVTAHFGAIDGLINNAGIIQHFVPVKDLSAEEIQRVMNINFYGTVNLTMAFLPLLLARPEAHIVNVSSMGGFLPVPGQTIYGASKAAVKLFTEGLYSELIDTGVRVTVVFPGAIATNITENSGLGKPHTPAGSESKFKALPAQKAGTIILEAIEKNKFRVLVGPDARFMDYLYRLNPQYATQLILKQMKSLLKLA